MYIVELLPCYLEYPTTVWNTTVFDLWYSAGIQYIAVNVS